LSPLTFPAFTQIDRKNREGRLQKLWSLTFYILVVVWCVTQIVSESKAGEEGSGKKSWRRIDETVIYRGNAPTKVTVIGNSVLVPVALVSQNKQVDVQLMLDTGASGTVIHTEIADRLNMNLSTARKTRGRVVGGAVIEAHQVTLRRITFGPHTREDIVVFVVPHQGSAVKYDGLLGMDILRGLKYNVDFEKQVIIWE
jgi:clan AA aspartic protease (TIGR02281 family)